MLTRSALCAASLLAALVSVLLAPSRLIAQTVAQKADALRRRGTVAEFQQLSMELERTFRLANPGFRQEFANRLACDFTAVTRRGAIGAEQIARVAGDAGELGDRFEVVKNDTTGLVGLRIATRDGMPVLNGLRDGQRPEEVTGFTLWVGPTLSAFEMDARRALLTRYIDRCHKYF
jgi:hypothetical protein